MEELKLFGKKYFLEKNGVYDFKEL